VPSRSSLVAAARSSVIAEPCPPMGGTEMPARSSVIAGGLSGQPAAELLQPAVQAPAIHSEQARGLGLVAADHLEHLADVAGLELVEGHELLGVLEAQHH